MSGWAIQLPPLPKAMPQVHVVGPHDAELRESMEPYYTEGEMREYARAALSDLVQADRAFDIARARKQEVDNRFVRLNAEKKPASEQDHWDRKNADHAYARAADARQRALARVSP